MSPLALAPLVADDFGDHMGDGWWAVMMIGMLLFWALVALAVVWEGISKRRGRQVAKLAVARKILTLCFYGLRAGEIRCLVPRAGARTLRTLAVTS